VFSYSNTNYTCVVNVINGQVYTRQVITNIQYQIVGVYWMNDSTPFVDWYFDVMKAQTGSAGVKSGKCQVIVRFLSYRTRNLVYTNKKSLRANPDGIFITENLTPYRTNLTKRLSQLKFDKQIAAYWTSDGRIFIPSGLARRDFLLV
jgi:hypothetical protein